VDWFTVGAQVFNFLVLVLLLKKFLYGPIVRAMDKRQARLVQIRREAEDGRQQAQEKIDEYETKRRRLEDKSERMLAQARQEAEDRKKELLREARQEVDQKRAAWYGSLEREKQAFLGELRSEAGRKVLEIAERALRELADADLEERMSEVFLGRLGEIEEADRQALAAAVKGSEEGLVVRSAFDLPVETQKKISRAIGQRLGLGEQVRFLTSPEIVGGIELRAGGYKIAWSLKDHLDSLAADLAQVFEDAAQPARAEAEEAPSEEAAAGKKAAKRPRKAAGGKAQARKSAAKRTQTKRPAGRKTDG